VTKLHAFPVKRGAPDRKAIKRAIEVLNEKQVLGIFPEGTRSKDGKLQEPESGIALIAAKSNDVTLVPVAINGNYKWLSSIDVIFGEPIKFDTYFQKGEKMNSQKKEPSAFFNTRLTICDWQQPSRGSLPAIPSF
jgi:1-acyl-sn-glycerol-3-phosphate acyltransferase